MSIEPKAASLNPREVVDIAVNFTAHRPVSRVQVFLLVTDSEENRLKL